MIKFQAKKPKINEETINLQAVSDENIKEKSTQRLNDDCLHEIFKRVSIRDRMRFERVSKQWQRVSRRPWQDVTELDLDYDDNWSAFYGCGRISYLYPEKAVEKLLIRCGPSLIRLEINGVSAISEIKFITIIMNYCSNLRELGLDLKKYSEIQLRKLFSQCKQLCIIGLFNIGGKFTGNCLKKLQPETITKLTLESPSISKRFSCFPRSAARAIREFCNLETLQLYQFVVQIDLLEIIMENRTIKNLSLCGCSIIKPINFSGNSRYFDTISLSTCIVTDDFLCRLPKHCTQLIHLDMTKCKGVTDWGLCAVAALPTLESLVLHSITTISGDNFGDMSSLKQLDCSFCKNICDHSIIDLLKNAPNLEDLKLQFTKVTPVVLREADRVTQQRDNSVILNIYVHSKVIKLYNKQNGPITSTLLKFHARDLPMAHSIYSSSDSSDDSIANYLSDLN